MLVDWDRRRRGYAPWFKAVLFLTLLAILWGGALIAVVELATFARAAHVR